jgi:hypothetical protein
VPRQAFLLKKNSSSEKLVNCVFTQEWGMYVLPVPRVIWCGMRWKFIEEKELKTCPFPLLKYYLMYVF